MQLCIDTHIADIQNYTYSKAHGAGL